MNAAPNPSLVALCATEATRPSSIVICADPELRSLAVLRTKLLNDARQNLRHDQYQALQDDQNRWIKSYTRLRRLHRAAGRDTDSGWSY